MSNLGGHDLPSAARGLRGDRPRSAGLLHRLHHQGVRPADAGHKDNHAGLMTVAQMEKFRTAQNMRTGHEWDKFEGLSQEPAPARGFLAAAPFNARGPPPALGARHRPCRNGWLSRRRRKCRPSKALV
jgi:pyruvate dehydrogenase E1 component